MGVDYWRLKINCIVRKVFIEEIRSSLFAGKNTFWNLIDTQNPLIMLSGFREEPYRVCQIREILL